MLIIHSDRSVLDRLCQVVSSWDGSSATGIAEVDKIAGAAAGDYDMIVAEYRDASPLPEILAGLWPWLKPVFVAASETPAPESCSGITVIAADDAEALLACREKCMDARRELLCDKPLSQLLRKSTTADFRRFCEGAIRAETLNEGLKELGTGISELAPCAAVALLSLDSDDTRLLIHCMQEVPLSFVSQMRESMLNVCRYIADAQPDMQSIRMHANGMSCEGEREFGLAVPYYVPAMHGSTLVGLFGVFPADGIAFTPDSAGRLYQVRHQLSLVLASLSHTGRIAARDVLTDLFNRRGLNEEFERSWQLAKETECALGVITMDIDHFKTVNDTCGHAVGDIVLQEMADIVRWATRTGDLAGRTGGDEFVLLLPGADPGSIRAFADRLMNQVRKHIFCKTMHGLRLSISLGAVSCFPGRDDLTPAEILIQSDYALYHAKRTGRDRLCLWTDIPTTVKQQPMQLEVESGPEESGDLLKKRIAGRILAVEDDPLIARLLQRILEKKDYEVKTALSAEEAMEAVQGHLERFDLVLVDLNLPGEQGLDFLKRLKRMDETVVGIVITGMASSENILASLRGGAFDFIAKPFRPEIVQQSVDRALQFRRLLVENRNYALDLEAMVRLKSKDLTSALTRLQASYMFTLEAFAALVGAREQDTGQHSHRVSEIARMISEKLALPDQEIEDITRGALLHDIGKIAIPDAILLKPGPLTDAERTIMQTHAEVGYNILKSSEALCNVAELVYSHQERFDGSGYPRGLRGEEICIGARIFSVIDAYDAMRAHRVYRKSMTVEKAVEELKRGSGSQFDPEVVKAFLALLPEIEAAGQWPEGE